MTGPYIRLEHRVTAVQVPRRSSFQGEKNFQDVLSNVVKKFVDNRDGEVIEPFPFQSGPLFMIFSRLGTQEVREGDWIVEENGLLFVMTDEDFTEKHVPAPADESSAFKIL